MKTHNDTLITNSTCLVTGGEVFIGSHIADALTIPYLHNNVVIIYDFSTGKLENISHHFHDNKAYENFVKGENNNKAYASKNKKEEQKQECIESDNHLTFIKADITDIALLQILCKKEVPLYFFLCNCYSISFIDFNDLIFVVIILFVRSDR